MRGARLAIRARTCGISVADVDRALGEERSVVVTWLNRGTLHLIRREDYGWLHALTTPQLATGNARRLEQEGVSAAAADRGVKVIARALADEGADFYVCGPEPFMALVKRTLTAHRIAPERILVERFTPTAPVEAAEEAPSGPSEPVAGTVTVDLRGERRTVPQRPGETLLQSARRAGFTPPFSCESGDCATCMARLTDGEAKMRVNNALAADEVAEGHVLTCQAEPTTPDVTVVYED